jgi:hypothetical protein
MFYGTLISQIPSPTGLAAILLMLLLLFMIMILLMLLIEGGLGGAGRETVREENAQRPTPNVQRSIQTQALGGDEG